ncbi:MAG: SNF2-related protein [Desulfosoma sp.]
MAVDKDLKRKRKRKEKEAKRRAALQREAAAARMRDLQVEFDNDMMQGQYERAWKVADRMRRSLPPNHILFLMLHASARFTKARVYLYEALRYGFENGLLRNKEDLLELARLSYEYVNRALMKSVLDELEHNGSAYAGRLTKRDRDLIARLKSSTVSTLIEKKKAEEPLKSTTREEAPSSHNAVPESAPPTQAASAVEAEPPEDLPQLSLLAEADPGPILRVVAAGTAVPKEVLDVALEAYQVSFQATYDELLCLNSLAGVESFWYQQETARKVMKHFRGRAILADEVGLGKTIEACLVLKEYMVRGLVKEALILVPSALVNQWQAELQHKFGLDFVSTNDELFKQDPDRFWRSPLVLASLQTARTKRHFDAVTSRFYDMVIVDEAHHLKNHTTVNWKLVNTLKKNFLLLLTATPVQNNLEELYNLVTLLKPGHLQTRKAFKEQFVARGNPSDPINREKLRSLLREVMVRNTRSVAHVQLPPRFAMTIRVDPAPREAAFYDAVNAFVREQTAKAPSALVKQQLRKVLEAVGSSPPAAAGLLENLAHQGNGFGRSARELAEEARSLTESAKANRVLDLVRASKDPLILFVNHRATLLTLHELFEKHHVDHVLFQGGMNNEQKRQAVDAFRNGRRVLLSTGTGGEGHNLQFCHAMINYDLPWNPMEIEQRIGRIHRIGQQHPVQIYNFCASGSIEDRILDVLDRKINMFELVVGEIDMILGRLQGEKEFAELVYELWVSHADEEARNKAFESLASQIKRARTAYEKTKALDETLFQDDFGM